GTVVSLPHPPTPGSLGVPATAREFRRSQTRSSRACRSEDARPHVAEPRIRHADWRPHSGNHASTECFPNSPAVSSPPAWSGGRGRPRSHAAGAAPLHGGGKRLLGLERQLTGSTRKGAPDARVSSPAYLD